MNISEAKARLEAVFPDFEAYWDSPDNFFREDDLSFQYAGLFAHFSHFFREHCPRFSQEQLGELGTLIEAFMKNPNSKTDLAVTTCFLENLAGESSAETLAMHLGPKAKKFMSSWEQGAA